MKDQLINLVFIFIITASLGCILGLSVLRLIDMKLTDVSINIPPIKIPPSNVTIEYPSWMNQPKLIDTIENTNMVGGNNMCKKNKKISDKKKNNNKIKVKNIKISENGGKNKSPDQNKCGPDFRSNNKEIGLSDYVKTKTKNVDSLKTSNFEDITYPNKSFVEINNHSYDLDSKYHKYTHNFDNNHQYSDYEIRNKQYYKNPEDMTMRQLNKFKKHAKFDKMTVNDYTNWLMLFNDHQLSPFNQKNLLKLRKGHKLCESDLPIHKLTPNNGSEYYNEMIDELPDL